MSSAALPHQLPEGLRNISGRHCTLDFDTQRPVPHNIIVDILEACRSLPSSANTQPWTVCVLQGTTRNTLSERILEKFDAGDEGQAKYELLPMQEAVADCGRQYYEEHLGVAQGDERGRRAMDRLTYEFWGAPLHLLLCCPYQQSVGEGVDGIFLDMGTLLTAILLGAHSHGLGGNHQFSMTKYHDVCRQVLQENLPEDQLVVCGVSLGWPREGRELSSRPDFLPRRLPVNETTRWVPCDSKWLTGPASCERNGPRGHSLIDLIRSRHCSHSLDTEKPVPKQVIDAILEAARNVPSVQNSQPWHVTVVQGDARDKLSARMLEEFDAGVDGSQSYKKYSASNTAQMQKGKDTYGYELYEVKHGLDRDDKAGRRQKYRPNYQFWGGPVLLLLNLPKSAVSGTFIDIGCYMYAILMGMHSYGLGGKPLGSVAKYTHICREVLGTSAMPEDEHLVCGLCIGWPTGGRDPVETPDFFPSRLAIEETTRWLADSEWCSG